MDDGGLGLIQTVCQLLRNVSRGVELATQFELDFTQLCVGNLRRRQLVSVTVGLVQEALHSAEALVVGREVLLH